MAYSVERKNSDVLTLSHSPVEAGFEQWYLLTSDWHRDNPHFNADLFHRLMRKAAERKAGIFGFGDLHDVMQGRNDPRRSYGDLKPNLAVEDYIDAIEDDAVAEIEPYADRFVMFSEGNHETAPKKQLGVNLTKRLARRIGCEHMGWAGWVEFKFSGKTGRRTTLNLWFEHGSGGGGKSSRGLQNVSYRLAYLPDADFLASGHIHWTWALPIRRFRKLQSRRPTTDIVWCTSLPTFKDEFDLRGGYHMEKGREPRPLGGVWLRFFYDINAHCRVGREMILEVE